MGFLSLGTTFHGRVFKGVEDLGFTQQTLTLMQGEVIGEILCKAIEIHFVCLTSLALRFISWYSTRVLLLSPSARVLLLSPCTVLAHMKDGETLLIKDSPLIVIWVCRRCYEQCLCLDDDIIELGLVLRDCTSSSSFSLSPPTVIAHLINEAYELWSHPRVVYSVA